MRRKKTAPHPALEQPDLAKIKEYLGTFAVRYTDAELYQLDRELAIGASLLLELYFQRKRVEKKIPSVFDRPEGRS